MSKLAKQGENFWKVMSGLFFSVASFFPIETRSFVNSTRVIKVSSFWPTRLNVLSTSAITLSMFDKFLLIRSKLSC